MALLVKNEGRKMAGRTYFKILLFISIFLMGIGCTSAVGQIIYVDTLADGASNGSSWTNAYNHLNDALAAASSGDEIRVAEGIYLPDQGIGVTAGDKTSTFRLITDVSVKGGYAGFSEPDPNDRDIENYLTILSGDLNGDDGPDFSNNSDNSYHVVTGSGTQRSAVLDGFTITSGNAYGSYGGGLYTYGGSPIINNCKFIGNFASRSGGGNANHGGSRGIFSNCIFKDNKSTSSNNGVGGGMSNRNSGPTLVNCVFIGNYARGYGGGISCYQSNPQIINCTISNNRGFGIDCVSWDSGAYPTVTNSIMWFNTHGSIAIHSGSPVVTFSNIEGGWEGEGNIDVDPEFAFDGDYHLLPVSPCVDAGLNDPLVGLATTDVDGNPRLLDGNGDTIVLADMGACEFNAEIAYIASPNSSTIELTSLIAGSNPDEQVIYIYNSGGGILNWSTTHDCDWLEVIPNNGSSSGEANDIALLADITGLTWGDYSCDVIISDPCALNNPQTVQVILHMINPTISGHIRDSNQGGVNDALVSTSDGTDSDTTDANGYYELIVTEGWSGTVTPAKSGWAFEPNERTYDDVTAHHPEQNYAGFPPPVISGYIRTTDGNGIEGIPVATGDEIDSDTTDPNGYYELTVPQGWSGSVTPNKHLWVFEPNHWTYTNVTKNQKNQDYTAFAPLLISGHIRDSNQEGIIDALVSTSDGTDTETTDANGYYEVTVPYNWSGTITPDKHLWIFEPNQWTYANVTTNQTNQDYTAFAPLLISGYIKDPNEQGLSGVLVSASEGTDSYTTDANGYYELTVPQGWAGTVTPEKVFWFFEPNELAYENVTEDTPNQNFTATAIPAVIISGYVTNVGGKYVKNVDVKSQDIACKDTTDVNGFYELAVPRGFSGTVTASVTPGPPPPPPPPGGPPPPPGWPIYRKFEPPDCSYNNVVTDIAEQNYLMLGIRVRADGTGDARTIRSAVYAAIAGDEVILEPGRYTGRDNSEIDFRGKTITIRSVDPTNPAVVAATIIDPNRLYPGIYFDRGEGPDSVVDGLTITRGLSGVGGGIGCRDSSPTIRNCIIRDCYAFSHGGGIGLEDSNATITNCIIIGNSTTEIGGGIACMWGGNPTITNCIIVNNTVGWNGGGIGTRYCSLTVNNCTFSGNKAENVYNNDCWGGAISLAGPNTTISNSILWNNYANVGPEIAVHISSEPSTVSVSYCDVQGGQRHVFVDPCCTLNWGEGNIDADPRFALLPLIPPPPPPPPGPSAVSLDDDNVFWIHGYYHLQSERGRWKPSVYIGLDRTGDGFINELDLGAFAHYWKKQGDSIPADLDRSGRVNVFDLKLLLDNYLSSYQRGQWVTDDVTSPCIDAGDPNSDWMGELWPNGMRINMGAYGGRPEASMSLSDVGNIADLVTDGCIGYIDMKQLTDKWLYEEVLLAEDLDRNGFVNFTDFAIFTNNLALKPGLQASNPYPPDMAGITNLDADLSWTTGPYPISHDVYFGTSNPPSFIWNQTATTFDPGTMTEGTTYYWRIDEVSPYCTIEGRVWRFTIMTGPPPPPL